MSVCLSMIVRDESERLQAVLESVAPHIDHAVIVDTGSRDNTVDLARELLDELGIAGEVHEREWTDFATARNQALELARGKSKYILIMDADQTLDAPTGALETLDGPWYAMRVDDGQMRWTTDRLIRDVDELGWHWYGEVHERLVCQGDATAQLLEAVTVRPHGMGGARTERYERDVEVMERMLARNPLDMHTTLHLANTCLLTGRGARAHELYEQLLGAELDTSDQHAAERRYVAMWHLGDTSNDPETQLHWYTQATLARPRRLEAAHQQLRLLSSLGRHQQALELTSRLLARSHSVPDDQMMVMPWIYDWGIVHERGLAAARLGYLDEAIRALRYVLGRDSVPQSVRAQTRENLVRVERARGQHARTSPH